MTFKTAFNQLKVADRVTFMDLCQLRRAAD